MRTILRWLRRPRVDPPPDWWGPACTCPTCVPRDARADLHATLRAEGTRYDAEWPSVIAAEAPGGDLAAMAAPWPGMARDALGTYAEPVEVHIEADTSAFREVMESLARTVGLTTTAIEAIQRARADLQDAWTVPSVPSTFWARGRHRQTDPLDLILADLRDLDGL